MANAANPMPWWQIIAILVVVGLVVGVALGLLAEAPGYSTSRSAAGVGAAIGVLGVALINRRRKAAEGAQEAQ